MARLVTFQRNSVGGAVSRASGAFKVVALTLLTAGVCGADDCRDFSVVDTLSPPSTASGGSALISRSPPGGPAVAGVPKTVALQEHDVLALGRAATVDPNWLTTAAGERLWPLWPTPS